MTASSYAFSQVPQYEEEKPPDRVSGLAKQLRPYLCGSFPKLGALKMGPNIHAT